jgi:hypothetical protein
MSANERGPLFRVLVPDLIREFTSKEQSRQCDEQFCAKFCERRDGPLDVNLIIAQSGSLIQTICRFGYG